MGWRPLLVEQWYVTRSVPAGRWGCGGPLGARQTRGAGERGTSSCITGGEKGGRAALLFFLAWTTCTGCASGAAARAEGFLDQPARLGREGGAGWGLDSLGILNCKTLEVACVKVLRPGGGEGARGLSRKAKLESFVFHLFGFTTPLHRGQLQRGGSADGKSHRAKHLCLSVCNSHKKLVLQLLKRLDGRRHDDDVGLFKVFP